MQRWFKASLAVFAAMFVTGMIFVGMNAGTMQHWLSHFSGAEAPGQPYYNAVFYNWWSGPGSDLGEITLVAAVVGGVITGYRKINCHSTGCPWVGRHEYDMDGHKYLLCKRCHPTAPTKAPRRHEFLHHHRTKAALLHHTSEDRVGDTTHSPPTS